MSRRHCNIFCSIIPIGYRDKYILLIPRRHSAYAHATLLPVKMCSRHDDIINS